MIFRSLDVNGDWNCGRSKQDYLRDERAVELNIKTRIKSFLGDCFWAVDFGIDWWNLLGTRNPQAQANIIIQVRAMISASYGVVRINSVTANTDRYTRRLSIRFDIGTIFSHHLVGTVTP